MILRRYLAAALLLFCSYSYSEIVIGQTPSTATSNSLSWTMNNVLPQYTGLVVTAVSYKYTTIKEPSDSLLVNVQNLNAKGTGYIFRSQDDWSGRPGNTITRTIPTDDIPIQYWGNGEIKTEGKGQVTNPYVLYSYRYDTCFGNVVTDPKCPNYKPPVPEVKYTDPLEDEYVKKSLEKKVSLESEEESERNSRLLKKEQQTDKKKAALVAKTIQNSLLTAEAAAQAAAFESLNNPPSFALYSKTMPGGVYPETIKYVDKVLPDSKNSLRLNRSQEQLHIRLTDLQYDIKSKD